MSTAEGLAIEQLRIDEGLRLEAYPDPLSGADPWTIGYGCTGHGIERGTVWTNDHAEAELEQRVHQLAEDLDKPIAWWRGLDAVRGSVLLNMAFNMGVDGLLGFTNTLALVKSGDYAAAAVHMLDSKWATQVGARATRLADMMETGARPDAHVA